VSTAGAGGPEAATGRADEIRKQVEAVKAEQGDPDQVRLLEQRLAGLTGGVAVIKGGGATEAEMREKKDRVEDAMYATKCAAESGVVPGGGLGPLLAGGKITLKTAKGGSNGGAEMLYDVCSAPMKQIAENAGKSGDAVVDKVLEYHSAIHDPGKQRLSAMGYDAANDRYFNMILAGILDPLKAVKEEIINALSVAM